MNQIYLDTARLLTQVAPTVFNGAAGKSPLNGARRKGHSTPKQPLSKNSERMSGGR